MGTEVAHVALATAAAPTYFKAARIGNKIARSEYFDGGVWANCPAMAAIVEAVHYLGVALDRIDVLSVGTTDEPFNLVQESRAGIIRFGRKLIELLMNAQAESVRNHAELLTGDLKFMRVNATAPRGSYSLDRPDDIEQLAAEGSHEASRPDVLEEIQARFLNGVHVAPWQEGIP
jgi:hypothetical protein